MRYLGKTWRKHPDRTFAGVYYSGMLELTIEHHSARRDDDSIHKWCSIRIENHELGWSVDAYGDTPKEAKDSLRSTLADIGALAV